jgi:hypothetical protein
VYRNWNEIRNYPWQLNWKDILIGLLVYAVSLFLTATIWGRIIGKLTGFNAIFTHWRLYIVSNLANRLPTPLPWIGARLEAYSNLGIPRTVTLTSMSIDLTSSIMGALIASLATFFYGPQQQIIKVYNPLIFLILVPLIVVALRPKWLFGLMNHILVKMKRPPVTIQVRTLDMAIWIGVYTLIWANGGVLYYILARSIYPVVPGQILIMMNVFAVSGLVGWLGQILFFIPNMAIRQVAVAFMLSFTVPWPVAVAIALYTRILGLVYEVVCVFAMVLLGVIHPNKNAVIEFKSGGKS